MTRRDQRFPIWIVQAKKGMDYRCLPVSLEVQFWPTGSSKVDSKSGTLVIYPQAGYWTQTRTISSRMGLTLEDRSGFLVCSFIANFDDALANCLSRWGLFTQWNYRRQQLGKHASQQGFRCRRCEGLRTGCYSWWKEEGAFFEQCYEH